MNSNVVRLLFFMFSFGVVTHSLSQSIWKRDYHDVDAFARSLPPTVDLATLARELTEVYSHPADKYRAIYTWIATHIAYDTSIIRDPMAQELHPIKIILNQKTGCAGFARLFYSLCQAANLECEIIKGWSSDENCVGKSLTPLFNHEWNAIKIDSEWYLCDVTWGAGQVVDGRFIFDFNGYYFCTPSHLFALEHFPVQKKWLLGVDMNKRKYTNIPYFYSPAIAANIQEFLPKKGIVLVQMGETQVFSFNLEVPVKQVSIVTPSHPTPLIVPFVQSGNKISFHYRWDSFSPFIQILVNKTLYIKYQCEPKIALSK